MTSTPRGALFFAAIALSGGAEATAQPSEKLSTTMSVQEVVQAATQEMARQRFQMVTTDANTGLVVGRRSGTPYELLQTIQCRYNSMRDRVEQSLTVTVRQASNGSMVEISSDARVVQSSNQFQTCETSASFLGNLRSLLSRGSGAQRRIDDLPGRYLFRTGKANSGDYIEFRENGRFHLQQLGKAYEGEYFTDGSSIYIKVQGAKQAGKAGVLNGTTITDPNGSTWEKVVDTAPDAAATPSRPSSSTSEPANGITIDQLIKMVEAKLPDDVIIKMLEGEKKPIAAPEDLLKLKAAGASDAIIRALVK